MVSPSTTALASPGATAGAFGATSVGAFATVVTTRGIVVVVACTD